MRTSVQRVVSLVACLVLGLLAVPAAFAQSNSGDEIQRKSIDVVPHRKSDEQGSTERGRVLALVVGVNEYQHRSIEKLKFAVGDARAVRDRVIPKMPGIQYQVNFLENEQATRRRILGGLDELAYARPNDTVLIYFSLHGVTDKSRKNGFLVPYDADPENVESTGVPVQTLLERVGTIKADRVFVLLDACFSGTAASGWSGGAKTFTYGATAKAGVALSADIYETVKNQKGHFILSASKPNQPALELRSLGHSLFTYFVIKGLEGEAARPENGYVTVFDLHEYVSKRVEMLASAINEKQTPMLAGDTAGAPPIITYPRTAIRPDLSKFDELIREARVSFQSSRLLITGNGSDRIELYVNNDLKWSGSERTKEYIVRKEDFDRYGKEVQVRIVAVPTSSDRRPTERTLSLTQGDERPLNIESALIPRAPGPAPLGKQGRVPPPNF